MKRVVTRASVGLIFILAIFTLATISQASVTLDYVEGMGCPGGLRTNVPVTFNLRATNNSAFSIGGFQNGFRVYSPDGASWQPITWDTASIGWIGRFMNGLGYLPLSVTGSGADTIAFSGLSADAGFEIGFDRLVWSISTMVYPEDLGKTLCLDSCYFPPMGYWIWSTIPTSGSYYPEWSGPFCFTIGPAGSYTCGDVNNDSMIDIFDLIYLVNYIFMGGDAPPEPDAADMDGYLGLNVADLKYLINFLYLSGPPPSSGGEKAPYVEGGSVVLDHVDGLYKSTGQIKAGEPINFWIRVTNDMTDKATGVAAMTNGFRVYSPDGAQWNLAAEATPQQTSMNMNAGFFVNQYSVDGQGADTIGFGGYSDNGTDMAPGFNEIVYKISLDAIDASHNGKTICLDSSWYPPVDEWVWATGGSPAVPSWGGPHCFTIVAVKDYTANFSADVTSGSTPLTVQFTVTDPGSSTSWLWDFGDGDTSPEMNPQHTYTTAGLFDVSLTISDAAGSESSEKIGYIKASDDSYVDLAVEAAINPLGYFPDADLYYWCSFNNRGTRAAQDCELKILLPDLGEAWQLDDLEGLPVSHTIDHDTLIVNLGSIDPSSNWSYLIPSNHIPPGVAIGSILNCEMWISTSDEDTNEENDYYRHTQEVADPFAKALDREKLAYPDGKSAVLSIMPTQSLVYTIRFKNTSGVMAYTVTLEDPLDPSLDPGEHSLEVYPAVDPSNPACDCEFDDYDPHSGTIRWFCDGINLEPDQEVWFNYRIDPKMSPELLESGTEISNSGWVKYDLGTPFEVGPVMRLVSGSCCLIKGDFDGNGQADSYDILGWVRWAFNSGADPPCRENLDMDNSMQVDVSDIIYWVKWSYESGPDPGPCLW